MTELTVANAQGNSMGNLIRFGDDNETANSAIRELTSENTKRNYKRSLIRFFDWFRGQEGPFDRNTVLTYVERCKDREMDPRNINQQLAAIKKLAEEAQYNGLINPHTADGIRAIRNQKSSGQPVGTWLTASEIQDRLDAIDTDTLVGKRDRAVLVLALYALRRDEIVNLTTDSIVKNSTGFVLNVVGKGNKTRALPMHASDVAIVNDWLDSAGISEGPLVRGVGKGGRVRGKLTGSGVHYIVGEHMGIRPHDVRRSVAQIWYEKIKIDQISLMLGHSSILTTERYLNVKQDFDVLEKMPEFS
jgi:site-specific recombinase XerD